MGTTRSYACTTQAALTRLGSNVRRTSRVLLAWCCRRATLLSLLPWRWVPQSWPHLKRCPEKPVPIAGAQLCPWNARRKLYQHVGNFVGSVASPLLANIYLHELDRYMESNYLNLGNYARERRRKQGKSNFLYVRYADDFVVFCNGSKAEALAMKEELKGVLSNMGLTLSEEKTKVTHVTEGFDFLGYRIIRSIGTKGKMVPKVLIPMKAIKQAQYKIRAILAPGTTNESYSAKIIVLNRLIRGWCEYYRSTSSPQWGFREIERKLFWDMAHWLGKKYKVSIPTVLQTYMQGNTFGTKSTTLVLPTTYKAKRYLAKTWHNPYTEQEAIIREKIIAYESLWLGTEEYDRKGYKDLREEVILLKGTTCYLCGTDLHPSEVEIDHDTPRSRFKDKTEADRMKHLQPLCTSCHRAKTKTDLKVLSRMR
jgi:RNA-directed DNA polymerase